MSLAPWESPGKRWVLDINEQERNAMTRKDYELIAEAFSYGRMAVDVLAKDTKKGQAEAALKQAGINQVMYRLAGKLAEDNPRFDRNRFLAAASGNR